MTHAYLLAIRTSTGNVTINLPTDRRSLKDGRIYKIIDVDGQAGKYNITINGNGKTICGYSSILISEDYTTIFLMYFATPQNWIII